MNNIHTINAVHSFPGIEGNMQHKNHEFNLHSNISMLGMFASGGEVGFQTPPEIGGIQENPHTHLCDPEFYNKSTVFN